MLYKSKDIKKSNLLNYIKEERNVSITLYDLTEQEKEIKAALQELEELEDKEAVERLVSINDLINAEIVEKAEGIIYIARDIESDISTIDDEIKRLQALKKRKQNAYDRLKNMVKSCLEKMGRKKIETPFGNLTIRKNPDSIKIIDESLIPEEYIKTEVVKKVDKKKIKEWLKETGEVICGTEVVSSTSLLVPRAKKGDE